MVGHKPLAAPNEARIGKAVTITDVSMPLKRRLAAAMAAFQDPSRLLPEAADQNTGAQTLQRIQKTSSEWSKGPNRWARVSALAHDALKKANLTQGHMLEIGGRLNPRNKDFPGFEYSALDLKNAPGRGVKVEVGDITNCPHIPDESFDFIFSLDVFEHIDKPWLAGGEIQRLLRPGGVTMHSTLFSWRYHPCPIDYWRYSPDGLRSLFPDLICLHADFDMVERRRDIRGQDGNALKIDAFGGWRENVRVNYVGLKR